MPAPPARRLLLVALGVLVLDQLTKWIVLRALPLGREWVVLDGFFKFVHWGNTGAAWSLFHGNNLALSIVSGFALIALFFARRHFDAHTARGQVALGLILGGIAGNLFDRLVHGHVVDFLYFHLLRRDGRELGFPAFNVADTAICTGVGLVLLFSLREQPAAENKESGPARPLVPEG